MRLGNVEVNPMAIKAGATTPAAVRLQVKVTPFVKNLDVTPDQARALAAELVLSANLAEGKS